VDLAAVGLCYFYDDDMPPVGSLSNYYNSIVTAMSNIIKRRRTGDLLWIDLVSLPLTAKVRGSLARSTGEHDWPDDRAGLRRPMTRRDLLQAQPGEGSLSAAHHIMNNS